MGDLIKQIKDIFCTLKFNSLESSLSDLIRPLPDLHCNKKKKKKRKLIQTLKAAANLSNS